MDKIPTFDLAIADMGVSPDRYCVKIFLCNLEKASTLWPPCMSMGRETRMHEQGNEKASEQRNEKASEQRNEKASEQRNEKASEQRNEKASEQRNENASLAEK